MRITERSFVNNTSKARRKGSKIHKEEIAKEIIKTIKINSKKETNYDCRLSFECVHGEERRRQYSLSRRGKMAALRAFTLKRLKYASQKNRPVLSHFYLSGRVSRFHPLTFTTPCHASTTFIDLSFSHGALIVRLNYISREEDVLPRGGSRQNEFTLSFTFVKLVPPRRLN